MWNRWLLSTGWYLKGVVSLPACFSVTAISMTTLGLESWRSSKLCTDNGGGQGKRLWLISKAAYLRLYFALAGTKQQSAAPATDICYKSLAISSVERKRDRESHRESGGRVTKKWNRHLSLNIVYSICFYFEISILVLSLFHFPSRFSIPTQKHLLAMQYRTISQSVRSR